MNLRSFLNAILYEGVWVWYEFNRIINNNFVNNYNKNISIHYR